MKATDAIQSVKFPFWCSVKHLFRIQHMYPVSLMLKEIRLSEKRGFLIQGLNVTNRWYIRFMFQCCTNIIPNIQCASTTTTEYYCTTEWAAKSRKEIETHIQHALDFGNVKQLTEDLAF
ncbi:hypothetical protein AV530_014127 [Patagioenas fasciata monilis]|uniref:Uncharacterized protein n=1 Tax=Patagioenas fasciata monilis TaxID=372326 RepID=A0A1V4KD05_PATFA|nr:hypothetical protein AV530_014127 [Patagioenas fasciata monilis]